MTTGKGRFTARRDTGRVQNGGKEARWPGGQARTLGASPLIRGQGAVVCHVAPTWHTLRS